MEESGRLRRQREFLIQTAYWAVWGTAGVLLIKFVGPALLPFVIAFLTAWALAVPTDFLSERMHVNRKAVSVVVVVLFYAAVAGLLFLFASHAVSLAQGVAAVQRLFLGDRHISRLIDRMAFGRYNRKVEHPRTAFDWLSRDGNRVDRYIADPQCGFVFTVNGFRALFELISRLYSGKNLEQIPKRLPVCLVSGTGDPVGGYGVGVKKAYGSLRKAGMEDVTMKLYPEGRHELLNEINRDEVTQNLCRWLERMVLKETR